MKHVRHYSVDYLLNHLKEANRIFPSIERFWIEDDTFFSKSLDEITTFSKRYKEEINKPFYILISPWTFHEQKLEALVNAGMNAIIMGIQSGSENTNYHIYNRKIPTQRILEITQILNKYKDIRPCYDFIGMNPFENAQDLIATIRLIRTIPLPFFIFNNNLAFYPGTEIYDRARKQGFKLRGRTQHSDPIIGYKILFRERIQHKLLHFLLLFMAGDAHTKKIGNLPRFLLKDNMIKFYLFLDYRAGWAVNLFISAISGMILLTVVLKKFILVLLKKLLGAQRYLALKNSIKTR